MEIKSVKKQRKALHELADFFGIQTSYRDSVKKKQYASDKALLSVLKAMGVSLNEDQDFSQLLHNIFTENHTAIEPVIVAWDGIVSAISISVPEKQSQVKIFCQLVCENNFEITWTENLNSLRVLRTAVFNNVEYVIRELRISKQLPLGYHHLTLQMNDQHYEAMIIAAPSRIEIAEQDEEIKDFGLFVPIYSLHSERSVGCGDLTDFKNFIEWSVQQGANFAGTLPIHSVFLNKFGDFSPYSAITRFFWNEIFLDVTNIPEYQANLISPSDLEEINSKLLVDYKKIMHVKRAALEQMLVACQNTAQRHQKMYAFAEKNPEVKLYAAFRAAVEIFNLPWQKWSFMSKHGSIPEEIFTSKQYFYHIYVQWLLEQQLTELKDFAKANNFKLYFDMPLGVNKNGYDVWRHQNVFALDASIGSPPDAVFTKGQNWSLPPLHPRKIRQTHYKYFIESLRAIMPYVDLLRIDHVMAFNRLFWIPKDCETTEGVYVDYAADEFYAILCLEANRHAVNLVGENLGTVPPMVNKTMKNHQLHQMYVVEYEIEAGKKLKENIPRLSVASLNTHDMPTFAAFCKADDIYNRLQQDLLDDESAQAEMVKRNARISEMKKFLLQENFLQKENFNSVYHFLEALLVFLAHNKQQFLLINLEDLWLESTSQNIPTTSTEAGNWQHRTKLSMEEFAKNKHVLHILHQLAKIRRPSSDQEIRRNKHLIKINRVQPFSLLTEEDIYLFNEGNHHRLYQKLGAHVINNNELQGVYFAVWVPNAKYVSVIGNFNYWNKFEYQLIPRQSSGIWEGFIPGLKGGEIYKYFIESHHHYAAEKADPFGFLHELPPRTASVVTDLDYEWHDQAWMKSRYQKQNHQAAISIYEMHLGSWRRIAGEDRFLTYVEIAPLLVEYIKSMGYTHVEFMPIMEHPFYDSWGYQSTGYFSPTSRYGSPQDLMYLIDVLHQNDIGVILDWVPSHFPCDLHGLSFFDGTHLYEHSDPRKGFHPDWKSAIFNYGRNEVRSFLISSALFWLDKYHIDGLRVDAVASMLYLDYSRNEGEWIPNIFGGRENLEAIHFLQQFNIAVYQYFPDVQTIAEESTAWGGVSRPTYLNGLGFGFKWDMGWMHDTLKYFNHDPIHRSYHHHELTFRMIYAFTENFVLALSHDEVVHGKGSLLGRMPGYDYDKFANLRILYGYMFSQPGKKCLFMGNDFGQWNEWSMRRSLDWHLLEYRPHQGIQAWIKKLNHLYREEPALFQLDDDPRGFEWIDCNDNQNSTLVYLRKSKNEQEAILVVLNNTPMWLDNYRVGIPIQGNWTLIANSDDTSFGGSGMEIIQNPPVEAIDSHGRPFSMNIKIPPLSIIFYKWLLIFAQPNTHKSLRHTEK